MAAALEVSNVTKRFGRTTAVQGVTLTIEQGDAVALLGPNGAGKTTLMRLCASLLRPNTGTVRIFGHDTASEGAAARRKIGVLSHDSFLYPDLSPTENLLFYARLFAIPDAQGCVDGLIERMSLTGWAHRPLRTLSRGGQQRCALARVLLHNPELLFLDEPFTGLDLQAGAILRDVLRAANQRGATLVMSTHDMPQVFAICTSAAVIKRGQLIWRGGVDATRPDEFEAHYLDITHDPPSAAAATAAPH